MSLSSVVDFGTPSPEFQEWSLAEIRYHGFVGLPVAVDRGVFSPEFTCLERQWHLSVLPDGNSSSDNGMISAYLFNLLDKVSALWVFLF